MLFSKNYKPTAGCIALKKRFSNYVKNNKQKTKIKIC